MARSIDIQIDKQMYKIEGQIFRQIDKTDRQGGQIDRNIDGQNRQIGQIDRWTRQIDRQRDR